MSFRQRLQIEERYGELGQGEQSLVVRGRTYLLSDLLVRLGLDFEDVVAIDAGYVAKDRFVLRYYDGEERRVAAYEFDAEFGYVGEIRAHIAEWIGDDAYYDFNWGMWCPWTL